MNSSPLRCCGLIAVALLAGAAIIGAGGRVSAQPPAGEPIVGDAFYVPPDPLPTTQNGDLIRSESVSLLAGLVPATGTRILYLSTDTGGAPVATSGLVMVPTALWTGPGPRPLVSYAVGTHGAGDACAASKLLTGGVTVDATGAPMVEPDLVDIGSLLARGLSVVVTDYQGIGTPGGHAYLQPVPEAHAVLDAARAAIRLGVATSDAPVGIWGYSQGGGAAAASAEQSHSYAPELNLKGTVAGGTPANPAVVAQNLDGKALTGLIGTFVDGVMVSHPELTSQITSMFTPDGIDFLRITGQQCDAGIFQWAYRASSDFTVDHRSIIDALRSSPGTRAALDGFVMGKVAPANPVLIMQNVNDDVVPAAQAGQLADEWCAQGANVAYPGAIDSPPLLPQAGLFGHGAGLAGAGQAIQWLIDRFAGVPAQSTC